MSKQAADDVGSLQVRKEAHAPAGVPGLQEELKADRVQEEQEVASSQAGKEVETPQEGKEAANFQEGVKAGSSLEGTSTERRVGTFPERDQARCEAVFAVIQVTCQCVLASLHVQAST